MRSTGIRVQRRREPRLEMPAFASFTAETAQPEVPFHEPARAIRRLLPACEDPNRRASHLHPLVRRVVAGVVEVAPGAGFGRAAGSQSTRSASRPASMAPFVGRPKSRAGGSRPAPRPALDADAALRHALRVDDAQQRLDARPAVADLRERRRGDALLGVEPVGDVIAADHVQDAVAQARPQGVDVGRRAQRRRDDALDDLGLVGIGVEPHR